MKYDTRLCWLPFLGADVKEDTHTCLEMAKAELDTGLKALGVNTPVSIAETAGADDGYEILTVGDGIVIRGGKRGVLYGAYTLMMKIAAGMSIEQDWSEPAHSLRMINHWDDMSGEIERGYAGASLFFENGSFAYDPKRLLLYGRYLASVGVNVVSINNVNVRAPADLLITEAYLPKLAKVADLLRPFGIHLLVAIDYALPVTCGLPTADPLDTEVQAWWKRQVALIYSYIPDLCGFLVKADSEFCPGPYQYRRNHAEGAHVLSQALRPFDGLLIWRCFVYNCSQDWRDKTIDRPMASFDTYTPLDGQFDDNVVLQIKYGPYDFQVREPASPLFYAMLGTQKALELQLTQEYTGQQIDLYYMLPQWQEIKADLAGYTPRHICAVSNLGNDVNWTGHDLAQANLFAYGMFAWKAFTNAKEIIRWWAALTFGKDWQVLQTLEDMLLPSREIYESYTAPLGLGWMVNPGKHYGPNPEGYEYSAWGTYIRADRDGIGIDRSAEGTGFVSQYPPVLAELYGSLDTCPENLLLFFHRLPYTYRLSNGKTLVQHVYDTHFSGAERAEGLARQWDTLEGKVPPEVFVSVRQRLSLQVQNACECRDVINTYFHRYSGIPDEKGRAIYD